LAVGAGTFALLHGDRGSNGSAASDPTGGMTASAAKRIAEGLAVRDEHRVPVLIRPSDARSMTFERAQRAIGSGVDYSLSGSAPVWLVHVYANIGGAMEPPPDLFAQPTTSTPVATAASTPNYYAIVDAASGRIVVENY
jgi:hypothetical protein